MLLCSFFLVEFEQCGQLGFVVCLRRIEGNHVVHLGAFEDFLLIFAHEIAGHEACRVKTDTSFENIAFGILFSEGTAQDILVGILLYFLRMSGLLRKGLHLLVDLLLGHLNIIISELIFASEFHLKLRSKCDVEFEFEVILVFDVLCLLLFRHHRFAKHAEFLFFDELLEVFAHETIDFVHLHLRAETLIDQAGRHFSFTETGHFGFRRDIFEFLLDSVLIVCLLHLHRDEGAHSGLFESNVHEVWCYMLIYYLSNSVSFPRVLRFRQRFLVRKRQYKDPAEASLYI